MMSRVRYSAVEGFSEMIEKAFRCYDIPRRRRGDDTIFGPAGKTDSIVT